MIDIKPALETGSTIKMEIVRIDQSERANDGNQKNTNFGFEKCKCLVLIPGLEAGSQEHRKYHFKTLKI